MLEPKTSFRCKRCGDCCRYWGGRASATANDLRRWMLEGRHDILRYIELGIADIGEIKFDRGDEWDGVGDIVMSNMFISPRTGYELDNCPFLRKEPRKKEYKCRIHDTKPDVCREFPYDSEGNARLDEGACEICPEIRKRRRKR